MILDQATIILILRWVIFITFLLLVAEGIAAAIMSRYFYKLYVRKHSELESRISALERDNPPMTSGPL